MWILVHKNNIFYHPSNAEVWNSILAQFQKFCRYHITNSKARKKQTLEKGNNIKNHLAKVTDKKNKTIKKCSPEESIFYGHSSEKNYPEYNRC